MADLNTEARLVSSGEGEVYGGGMGVLFRDVFDDSKDYFGLISGEHVFIKLTESDKPSMSYRKGVYITDVEKLEGGNSRYHLLRCSTNFASGTEGLGATDREVIDVVNRLASSVYEGGASLNHVLAQIYDNSVKSAKIKEHADKTKDMPRSGLMAFCSFYEGFVGGVFVPEKKGVECTESGDWIYKGKTSVLTRLRFRLKGVVAERDVEGRYVREFEVVLYPNSVFVMGLETNRLYTHEIVPPALDHGTVATRMGYVVRSSKTVAEYDVSTGRVLVGDGGVELRRGTAEDYERLRQLYWLENSTDDVIDYSVLDEFSMNEGDYVEPTEATLT